MTAYALYTNGLPKEKVAIHFIVEIETYKWSESAICANAKIAKHDMHLIICNWIKQTLIKYVNQRSVALKLAAVPLDEINRHAAKINAIAHKHNPLKIYLCIAESQDSIDFFLPSKESKQCMWIYIINQLKQVANEQFNVLYKQSQRQSGSYA